MSRDSQWSIGRLFLWVLVAALVASHFTGFFTRRFVDFQLNGSIMEEWVSELDPSATIHRDDGTGSSSGDAVDSDFSYVFSSENTTPEQILEHLRLRIQDELEKQNWTIGQFAMGEGSFSLHAHTGGTRIRIYGWLVPNRENSHAQRLEKSNKTVTTVRILRIGYQAQ